MEGMSSKCVNVSDENVQHHNLVAKSLVFFHNYRHFTILIKSTNCIVINQRDNRSLCLLVLVLLSGVVVDTLHAVAELEPRVLVRRDLAQAVGRKQVQVSLLVRVRDELRHGDGKAVLDLEQGLVLEPISLSAIEVRVLNGHAYTQDCLASLECLCVDAGAVKGSGEHCTIIVLGIIPDYLCLKIMLQLA